MRKTVHLIVLGLVAALLSFAGATATLSPAQAFVDRDCSDFGTQKQAQIFFLNAGGPSSDPHRLDADNDGVVCETLPCPCYYGTKKPGAKPKPAPKPKKPKKLVQHARIVKVIDGDTVKVRLRSGQVSNVRMIGIDTPEVYGGVQCWGREASAWLKTELPKRTRVTLISDPTQQLKDRYNRLLRYVIKKKGKVDMNRAQVQRGNAKVYVYGGKPFQKTKGYKKVQRKAKRRDLGLWGGC